VASSADRLAVVAEVAVVRPAVADRDRKESSRTHIAAWASHAASSILAKWDRRTWSAPTGSLAMETDFATNDGLRVLVIDSDTDTVESTAFLLRLDGYQVRTATSGAAALYIAATYEPDVVLLELGLPEMDGYTVARMLRDCQAPRIPFLIAVTGHGTSEERRRSADAGIDLHLVKPVDPGMLAAVLDRLQADTPRLASVNFTTR
jgi:CheY-like chemotaxis protein